MKHGTLSDRVDPGSAVNFHLPTNERTTPKSSTFTASNALVTDLVEIYRTMPPMSPETSWISKIILTPDFPSRSPHKDSCSSAGGRIAPFRGKQASPLTLIVGGGSGF